LEHSASSSSAGHSGPTYPDPDIELTGPHRVVDGQAPQHAPIETVSPFSSNRPTV
jgi:hypothetical protein